MTKKLLAIIVLTFIIVVCGSTGAVIANAQQNETLLVEEPASEVVVGEAPTTQETEPEVIIIINDEVEQEGPSGIKTLYAKCQVNVHKEPNIDSEVVLVLNRGDGIRRVDTDKGWDEVQINGNSYYVGSGLLVEKEVWDELSKVPYCTEVPLSDDLQKYLWNECQDIGMKYTFALALIDQETGGTFRADLISKTNDWGITQINKCNHKKYIDKGWITCSQDLLNPYNGIHCGLDFMNQYVQKYGHVERAYASYNTGKAIMSNANSRSFMKKYNKWIALLGDI